MANLPQEICSYVEVEPKLQPLSGEAVQHANASRDPWKSGLLSKPMPFGAECSNGHFPKSNLTVQSMASVYCKSKLTKLRIYKQGICDGSTLTPIVLSASRSFDPQTLFTFKRIASYLTAKWPYSTIHRLAWGSPQSSRFVSRRNIFHMGRSFVSFVCNQKEKLKKKHIKRNTVGHFAVVVNIADCERKYYPGQKKKNGHYDCA